MLSKLFLSSDNVLGMQSDAQKKPFGETWLHETSLDNCCYFSINPLDRAVNRNSTNFWRCSANVSAFRNFLFECDSLPLATQLQLLQHIIATSPIRFATVTNSGSASLHAIISVSDTLPFEPHTAEGIDAYSRAWRALNMELTEISSAYLTELPLQLFDPACKDASRLSRIPDAIRPDTNTQQTSVPNFGGYITADHVLSLMQKHNLARPTEISSSVDPDPSMSVRKFETLLSQNGNQGLKNKLLWPQLWASNSNMYPEVLKLTLWAIDRTGVPYATLLSYMKDKVFPTLHSRGYPRDPTVAVRNAYIWKGIM